MEIIDKKEFSQWQRILKKYIGTMGERKRNTKTRLNRRQPTRFDLSGSINDAVLKIVVAIDLSILTNDRMLSNIISDILVIIARRKYEITVILSDSEVRQVYKVRTLTDVKNTVKGCGPVKYSPVIDYINNDRSFKDSVLIYFTAGKGETEIPKPRTHRNLWVITDNSGELSLKEPYGLLCNARILDFGTIF